MEQARRRHADDLELESAWCNHLISRVTFPAPGASEATQKDYEGKMRLALEALQSQFPQEPAVAKLALMEAKCQATLAKKARDDRRLLEANERAVRAAERYAELAGPSEADEAKLWHAQTMRVVADYFATRDLSEEAAPWYVRAIESIEANPLVDSQRKARHQAAVMCASYGETLLKKHEFREAERILDRSVQRFTGLTTDFPEDFPYRRKLVQTLLVRCRCRLALDNRNAAAQDLDRAVENLNQLPEKGLGDTERRVSDGDRIPACTHARLKCGQRICPPTRPDTDGDPAGWRTGAAHSGRCIRGIRRCDSQNSGPGIRPRNLRVTRCFRYGIR